MATETEVVNFIEAPDDRLNDYVEEEHSGALCDQRVPRVKSHPGHLFWYCTRHRGHDGEHEAWGLGQLVAVWETVQPAQRAARGSVYQYEWDTVCTNCNRTLANHGGWNCLAGDKTEYDGPLRRRGTAASTEAADQATEDRFEPKCRKSDTDRTTYIFRDGLNKEAYVADGFQDDLLIGAVGNVLSLNKQQVQWLLERLENFVSGGRID